ncbi:MULTISPECIES: MerR family transcriptional regulator [unclassified Enterococcus]|uniref:MerR family transcriptional regulator n=1 Tax=unclassified Enterococcus TaxID=2608891 RepID=UPI00155650E1|nr:MULTISPECIES: MerR family transcriptional regulator [unclassified Enterococcus]MBS7576627.1 MerR family transcriptional regulator [Enterococcus sp. MMGLQ5-2]MBS7583886.1 MerR family transcriptional regulator [Enterococcus sp. MMGLQ5-1]NPD11747.1 MerR family transcriptional regulator [Enterococcus sp. MMGLQ5-1]NPD36464.1 MerR family transcriptional regulator [Enterococcus sp. MMGLQ5-2]
MNISKVADLMDLTPVTLRYYERVGLIPPVNRKNGGVRDYQDEDLNWVEFIKCMRNSGLSVEALIQYTSLYQLGDVTLDDRKTILVNERAKLIEKYEALGSTIKRLDRKIEDYDHDKMRQSEKRLSDWKKANQP